VHIADSWSFRRKPSGMFRRVLRIPVYLFLWDLGFLFGDRLVLVTSHGRRSGRVFQTPVEVVQHDQETHEYVVCSGTGPHADWFCNLQAESVLEIQVRNRRWVPRQRFLDNAEAARRFAGYERDHPGTARRLLSLMGNGYDGTEAERVAMMAKMPMVAFSDSGPERGMPR
jgi:deazaflavin-dependent oxidoreductase (nitroreductase family)